MKKIHIFYHVDLDGKSSAFLIKWAIRNNILKNISEKDVKFHEFNYGFDINVEKYNKNDIVFFLDCSPAPDTFNFLYERVFNLIWIDHHDTNIKDNKNLSYILDGERSIDQAACENTLLYVLKNMNEDVNKELLKKLKRFSNIIKLVGAYDTWNLNFVEGDYEMWEKEVMSVNFRLKSLNENPEDEDNIWEYLINSDNIDKDVEELKADGLAILAYVNKENSLLCESYGAPVEFEGLKFFMLNKGLGGSYVFSNLRKKESYDGFITFIKSAKNNKIKLSFYSNKKESDFNSIWEKHGGGGHAFAGGLWCQEIVIKQENNARYLILK